MIKIQNPQQIPEKQTEGTGSNVEIYASPFNGVKLELGLAIFIGIIVWSAADIITPLFDIQLMILAAYGIIAAIWLVIRTRRVLLKHHSRID